jgi:general secretion pathway protein K
MDLHLSPLTPHASRLTSHAVSGERGVALILALLVLSLLVALILEFDAEARRELKEAAVFRDSLRAAALSRASAQAIRAMLKEDQLQKKQLGLTADTLADLWATPLVNFPIGDGRLTGRLEDERGKLNLNLLAEQADETARKAVIGRFHRLFQGADVDPLLVDALVDWIDEDEAPLPNGAESQFYEVLMPPYRSANGALQTVGELHLIKGFTDEVVRRLRPYVTVHPSGGGQSLGWININTADPRVIATLDPQITLELAQAVTQGRPFRTVQDVDAVAGFEPIAKTLRMADAYRVGTDTFSTTATLTVNEVTKVLTIVLQRGARDDTAVVALHSE